MSKSNLSKRAITALKKSIKHWQENLVKARKHILSFNDVDSSKCALCNLYVTDTSSSCQKCPVYLCTGRENCFNTPYYKVRNNVFNNESAIENTKAELKFLISLLPEKERKKYDL
jgi:hypothetical protein